MHLPTELRNQKRRDKALLPTPKPRVPAKRKKAKKRYEQTHKYNTDPREPKSKARFLNFIPVPLRGGCLRETNKTSY